MLIVGLVKEDVFSVYAVSCEAFQDTLWADAMLGTQLLPKFEAN